jgi:ketosteroid isomerase-like protein
VFEAQPAGVECGTDELRLPLVHGGQNMRYFTYLLAALCLSASMLYAQDAQKLSPAQQEVLNVRKAMTEAALRRDMAAWSRYVADDCIFSDDDGVLQTKARLMELAGKLPHEYDHGENVRDDVVHVYGNTAVINLRFTEHEQFTDTDLISEMRKTETFVKQNGSWLLVASQWGKLPVNFQKPVAVDTSVYKDYVGQYEWRRLGDIDIVSVRDGKLWSQFGGDEEEYLPLSSDSFFVKSALGSLTFSRDAQGRVTGYTYHLADGQEIHVKKIK